MSTIDRCLAAVLGGLLAHGPAAAATAAVAAPTTAEPAAAPSELVVVDGEEVGIMSPAALGAIAESATSEAARHGIGPDQMRVSLVVIDHLEAIRGIRVSIVTPEITLATDDGDPRGPVVAECPACAEAELMTASIEGVLEALSRFEDQRAEQERLAEAASEPEPEPAPPTEPPAPADEAPRTRRPLAPLGWAGVVTLSLGVATVATGGTFMGLGTRPLQLETGMDLQRNYTTPGVVLLGVGGALVLSGAVMLATERRRSRRSATVALLPTPSGLVATGRF